MNKVICATSHLHFHFHPLDIAKALALSLLNQYYDKLMMANQTILLW